MKKIRYGMYGLGSQTRKLFFVMKLTVILFFLGLMSLTASTYSQTKKFSLDMQGVSLSVLFRQIESQSEFVFIYKNEAVDLNKKVSVNVQEGTVDKILESALQNTGVKFEIDKKQIIITTDRNKPEITTESAQQSKKRTIKGSISDASGKTIPGATVVVKGTSIGTVTNANGQFTLDVDPKFSVLQFSFIGMKTREEVITGKTEVNVILEEDVQGVEEVVVVAYGRQKKESLTGAISSIQTKLIKQSPSANLAVTLAGRLPGLTTIQTSGQPGQDATLLYLRGRGTTNGQTPLILVDGVPRDLSYIDPNEVQSVSILKDASSTAVFGVRGANGVILVTTKRGTNMVPEIGFSVETGLQNFTRTPTPVHSWEYAELRNQALANDGKPALYTKSQIDHYRNQDMPDLYPDNDWLKMLSKDYTKQTRYNLNLTGGTERATYFVNVGFLNQDGQFKTDQDQYDPSFFMKRYNFRSNIDLKINKSLSAFLNVGGYLEKANQSRWDALYVLAYSYVVPNIRVGPLTPDGQVITSESEGNSPYGMLNRSGYKQENRSNVTASFGMEQKLDLLTPGLSTKLMASFDTRTVNDLVATQEYQKMIPVYATDAAGKETISFIPRDASQNTTLQLSTGTTYESYFNYQWFINYARTFGGSHDVTGMLMYQQDERIRPGDNLPFRMMSVSGRATYGYDHRYFAEINVGYNGSEQFAKGHRFGFFPSLSGSWVVTNESFLKNNKTLSLLKLRGSYGLVGNDNLSSTRFLYLDDIKQTGGGYTGTLNGGYTINENYTGNPDLKWEIAKKYNFGLEIGLFDQLNLSVDLFSERRDNVLLYRGLIPALIGTSIPPVNMGKISNKGYEIELNYHKAFTKDFSFLTSINFNHAINKRIYSDEAQLSEDYAYHYNEQGYAIGQNWGLITDGYWNSKEEIAASRLTYSGATPRPGDFKYKDLNNDGVIDNKDYAPIRYSNVPQYTFGAAFSFTYKNVDLSFLFQGVKNVSKGYSAQGVYEFGGSEGSYYSNDLNAWTPERAASGAKITYPALSTAASASTAFPNDFYIQDCSYLRLKNLELGYTLPLRISQKIKSSKVRFYVNGLNLYTWDNMISDNFDPEVTGNYSYPMVKIVNFGVNVVF